VAVHENTSGTALELTDLHGDVIATAELGQTATQLKATFSFDEFGDPVSGSAGRYGWLGGKSRRTELPSGVIQMAARSYVPGLGRFLTPDPVPGGSANAYDYAEQDPVNGLDLGGTCSKKKCHGTIGGARPVSRGRRAAAHASRPCSCGNGTRGKPAKPFHVASCSVQLNPAMGLYVEGSPTMTIQGSVTYTCAGNAFVAVHTYTPSGTSNVFSEHGHPTGIVSYAVTEPVGGTSIGLCILAASGGARNHVGS
jgi:RHS repeat-associated protein